MTTFLETPLKDLSFEEALRELEGLVRKLEEGRVPLQEAIATYERGTHLRLHAEKLLNEARLKIDQIIIQADGTLTTQPSVLQTSNE